MLNERTQQTTEVEYFFLLIIRQWGNTLFVGLARRMPRARTIDALERAGQKDV